MRILTRNTAFKTAVLTGLLSCLLALAGAFFSTTVSVHAITAGEVETEAELKQFVEEAVDEYYIEFLIKERCDFRKLLEGKELPISIEDFLPRLIPGTTITDISPDSIRTLSTDDVKQLTSALSDPVVQGFLDGASPWDACELPQPDSTFRDVFTEEEENWRSGSIYLFVMDADGQTLFHGADSSLEGKFLDAEDEGGRDVPQLIIDEAEAPSNNGIVQYCWGNPDVDDDKILDSNENPIAGKAPGDSWKISYVVDPFEYLGAPGLSGSPGVIFGSGIYPTDTPPAEFVDCDGDGIESDGDGGGMDGGGGGTPVDTVKDAASGGCAIAAGSDNTPRGNAFNLLLIVSALFLTISFRSRAMDKRNGVQS